MSESVKVGMAMSGRDDIASLAHTLCEEWLDVMHPDWADEQRGRYWGNQAWRFMMKSFVDDCARDLGFLDAANWRDRCIPRYTTPESFKIIQQTAIEYADVLKRLAGK